MFLWFAPPKVYSLIISSQAAQFFLSYFRFKVVVAVLFPKGKINIDWKNAPSLLNLFMSVLHVHVLHNVVRNAGE